MRTYFDKKYIQGDETRSTSACPCIYFSLDLFFVVHSSSRWNWCSHCDPSSTSSAMKHVRFELGQLLLSGVAISAWKIVAIKIDLFLFVNIFHTIFFFFSEKSCLYHTETIYIWMNTCGSINFTDSKNIITFYRNEGVIWVKSCRRQQQQQQSHRHNDIHRKSRKSIWPMIQINYWTIGLASLSI